MEVHDGFSATIAERTGFEGLWVSATSIACSLGYCYADEAPWNQVKSIIERIVGSTELPVLADGDIVLRSVNSGVIIAHELRCCGAAGLALEDSSGPRAMHVLREQHREANLQKFCSRVRAVKDAVKDDLVLVVCLEAPKDECGMEETLLRAHDYARAGADAILLHSCKDAVDGIVSYLQACRSPLPIVVIPAKDDRMLLSAPLSVPLSAIIWANHSMHGAIDATRNVRCRLGIGESTASIERGVAIVDDLIEVLMYDELARGRGRWCREDNVSSTQEVHRDLRGGPSCPGRS
ncbi:isocitrate lyase/phosphoenolpyruvate mutase family protein [Bradyrhizobium sp. CCGUVB14]|nr:isocitrate lyase/phosphoenolpyruvate mutase family protein [Bradyrhizobium sp. CCGUVB14]